MARKNDSEDEAYEGYDEPSKKKVGKKKKKNTGKVIAWVAAFVVILGILLFIRFKYAATDAPVALPEEEAPADIVEEQNVLAPEKVRVENEESMRDHELGSQVVPKEEFEHIDSQIDTTSKPELFSNLRCEYDESSKLLYIKLRISNVLDEDIKISPRGVMKGYNTYFNTRGMVDADPGCQTELLQPGEWTECTKIGFDGERFMNTPGTNRISVQVPGKTEALIIDCPKIPEGADSEE